MVGWQGASPQLLQSQGREAIAILTVGVKLTPFGHVYTKISVIKHFKMKFQCFNEPTTRNVHT